MTRTFLLTLLFVALLLVGASCGGGAGITQLGDAKDAQGISEGGFNLVRYDDAGPATNALNPTLDLAVQTAADTTTVRIAIDDSQPMLGVTCDLRYDASQYTPIDVQFDGLIDTDVELAVTRLRGLVAVGQVSTDGAAARSGQFATVTFRNEPNRTVSAAGDAADKSVDSQYSANGFAADGFIAVSDGGGGLILDILGIFTSLSGDGNQDGASNIADLTPLGSFLGSAVTPTDAVPARADYDGNGLPNISDLTPLGSNLGEVTTGIIITVGDADPPTTDVLTIAWASGNDPAGPAVDTGDPYDVWRHFAATVDAASLTGIDANVDGHIFVSARGTNGVGADGPLFSPPVDIDLGITPTSNFVVTDVNLQVGGTTISDGLLLDLMHANDGISLEVSSFTGTYNGTPFTGGDVGTTVPQAEYDAELALIQEDVQLIGQTLSTAADFETDKPGVLLNFTHNGTGLPPAQPATATIFPDDDPANAAEGTATFGFNRANNTVADMTVTLDIQEDFDAPLIDTINGSAGIDGDGDWIVTATSPDVKGTLLFPSGAPSLFDDTTIDVEVVDLTNDARLPIDFDYTLAPPTLGGTFQVLPSAVPGVYDYIVRIPAGALSASNRYMLRFFDLEKPGQPNGSSVNKPGQFLTGGPVPTGFNSKVLPRANVNADENTIVIVPSDPQILRNPQWDVNEVGGTAGPHYAGAGDVLKGSGDAFTIQISNGVAYPETVVKAGNDPGVILSTDTQDPGGALQVERNPHRIVLDILNLADDVTTMYAYKVFGAPVVPGDLSTRPVITSGTFNHKADVEPDFIANITGVDFGINIYDGVTEGDLLLGNEDFSNKLLRFSSLPVNYGDAGTDVDVLFVQFNGGHIVPQAWPLDNQREGFSPLQSARVKLLDQSGSGAFAQVPLDVRITGVGTGSLDYIGLGHFTQTDNGGPAGLIPSFEYEVQLSDGFGGPVFSFGATGADPHITVIF